MGKNGKECFGEIRLTLPNGRDVVGRVPTLRQQLDVMELVNSWSRGKAKAQRRLIDWFPRLVGLEEELNQLTMEEFFEVVNCFFGRRGSGNGKSPEQTETQAPNECSLNTPDTTDDEQSQACPGLSS